MLVVALGTAIWPLARWILGTKNDVRVMGFWVSLASATLSGGLLAWQGAPCGIGPVWLAGAALGVSYAVGFILLIMRCLQIGPVGPTVTINNSALICGVVFGVVWLDPHVPDGRVIAGIAGVLAALALVGNRRREVRGPGSVKPDDRRLAISPEWKRRVMWGGAFSGLSFMSQAYVGIRHPGLAPSLLFVCAGFAVSASILLATVIRRPRVLLQRREMLGGILLGVGNVLGLPLTLAAFPYLGSEIVLPVTVTSPMIIVLLLSAAVYRERLDRWTWAGCCLAALAVGLMAWGSTQPPPCGGP